jgi:DNA-binding PucR family transcriptional regulator
MVTSVEPDGQWLHGLTGTETQQPASHPPLVAEALDTLGQGPVAWAVDLGHHMAVSITAEIPSFSGGEEAFQTLRMGTESSTLRSMLLLVSNDPTRIGVTEEALEGDRDFVRRGISLDQVLRGIQFGHSMMAHALLDAAATEVPEPMRALEMQRTSELLFEYIRDFTASMATEFLTERDRWVTSAAAERAELVATILDGRAVSTIHASTTLGYPLERHHLALVLWQEPGTPGLPTDLQRAATRLLVDSGCSSTLVVPYGAASVWVWASWRSRDVTLPTFQSPPEPGINVAIGTMSQGVSGFRQSHLEADQTAELMRSSPTAGAVTRYADLELVVLLSRDAELARNFVHRELGELAVDTPAAHELRETVATYLACDRSLAKSAELLHVARNTVAYRVKKVESLIGRDLHDRKLELESALRLAQRPGLSVLDSGQPSER